MRGVPSSLRAPVRDAHLCLHEVLEHLLVGAEAEGVEAVVAGEGAVEPLGRIVAWEPHWAVRGGAAADGAARLQARPCEGRQVRRWVQTRSCDAVGVQHRCSNAAARFGAPAADCLSTGAVAAAHNQTQSLCLTLQSAVQLHVLRSQGVALASATHTRHCLSACLLWGQLQRR
jgi:hypothetical protein